MLENDFLYVSDFSFVGGYVEITTKSNRVARIAAESREKAGLIRFLIGFVSPIVILLNIYVLSIPDTPRAAVAVISLLLFPLLFLRIKVRESAEVTAGVETSVETNVK